MVVFIVTDTYGVVDVLTDHARAIDRYNAEVDSHLSLGEKIVEETGPSSDHPHLLHETVFTGLPRQPYYINLERWDTSG